MAATAIMAGAVLLTGCGAAKDDTTVKVGAMSGPTAMTMVKIMDDAENGKATCNYAFSDLATDASAMVAPLTKGEIDIACIPSNLASVIYNKTEGGIVVLATCNLGVLNVVEKGDSVNAVTDLAGKKVYMTGEGAVPEYTVRYILSKNGMDFDKDIEVVWCADTTEALSYLKADDAAIAILPQPFVTAAISQVEGVRIAIDLNEAWNELDTDCNIVTGVVACRKEFAEDHPTVIKNFLEEYAASVEYTSTNTEEAAALIEKYGIVAKAPLAQKALPGCNLTCKTGSELKTALSGYLSALYELNPASVGGNLPGDDFYYNK
ncbi:MAG: ABC transporter substrate-binding protein [Lachnospiraceae bacterium]|nr:ABC transporter substrate-binding protein [Lachnospiraceae bacterium]